MLYKPKGGCSLSCTVRIRDINSCSAEKALTLFDLFFIISYFKNGSSPDPDNIRATPAHWRERIRWAAPLLNVIKLCKNTKQANNKL